MEIWKPVPNYEGLYEVSNFGNVRSIYRYKKVLKPMLSNTGYKRVDLFKNKKKQQVSIHRLVAKVFVANPYNKPFVNHKDETRYNNNADNLEWVTHKENCNYGTAIKRRVNNTDYSKRHINNARQKLVCSKPIRQIDANGDVVAIWASINECARANGWQASNISRSCKNESATAYGFKFREVDQCVRK